MLTICFQTLLLFLSFIKTFSQDVVNNCTEIEFSEQNVYFPIAYTGIIFDGNDNTFNQNNMEIIPVFELMELITEISYERINNSNIVYEIQHQYSLQNGWHTIQILVLEIELLNNAICRLLINNNQQFYIIHCIDGFSKMNFSTQITIKNKNEYKIQLNKVNNDSCEFLFQIEEYQIILWCFEDDMLKSLQIEILSKKINETKYQLQDIPQICLRKIMQIDNDQYILIFYYCKDWQIFHIRNKQMQQIFISQSLKQEQLIHITIQKQNIFLYFQNKYCILDLRIQELIVFESETLIITDNIFQHDQFFTLYVSLINKNNVNMVNNFYGKSFQIPNQNIELLLINNQFIIAYSDNIQIHYARFINKTYNYQLYGIKLFSNQNFIIGIDKLTENIQIFKLQSHYQHYPFDNKLQKYFFLYQNWTLFNQYSNSSLQLICFKPIYRNQSINLVRTIQRRVALQYRQLPIQFQLPKFNQIMQLHKHIHTNSTHPIDINDEEDYTELCNIKQEQLQYPHIFLQASHWNYSIYFYLPGQGLINFINCSSLEVTSFEIGEAYILNNFKFVSQNLLLYVEQTLFIFSIFPGQIIKTESILPKPIIQIGACISILFVTLIDKSVFYINKIILENNISFHQLNKQDLQYLATKQLSRACMLCKQNSLIIFTQKYITLFSFEQMMVISDNISKNHRFLIFVTLNISNNQLMLSVFYDRQLFATSIKMGDYNLYTPLIYSSNQNYLGVVVHKNNQNLILVYTITDENQLIQIDCIIISELQFQIFGEQIVYYNQQNKLVAKNLSKYTITINKFPQNLLSYKIMSTMLFQDLNFQVQNLYNLQIVIFNFDFKIIKRNDISFSKIQLSKQLNLQEYFIGNIEYIKLDNPNLMISSYTSFTDKTKCKQLFQFLCIQELNSYYNRRENSKLIQYQVLDLQSEDNKPIIIAKELLYYIYYAWMNSKKTQLFLIANSEGHQNYFFTFTIIDFVAIQIQKFTSEQLQSLNMNQNDLIKVQENNVIISNCINLFQLKFNIEYYNYCIQFYQIDKKYNLQQLEIPNFSFVQIVGFDFIKNTVIIIDQVENKINIYFKCQELEYKFNLQISDIKLLIAETELFDFTNYKTYLLKYDNDQLSNNVCQTIHNIRLFITFENLSVVVEIVYNTLDQKIEIQNKQIIRHIQNKNIFHLYYYDENHIIMSDQINNKFYYYDTTNELNFYDYIYSSQLRYEIQQLNSTHYIFYNTENQETKIGKLGYNILISQKDQRNILTSMLQVENDISYEQIELQIYNDNLNPYNITSTIHFICYINFLFILLIILTKNQIKMPFNQYSRNSIRNINKNQWN